MIEIGIVIVKIPEDREVEKEITKGTITFFYLVLLYVMLILHISLFIILFISKNRSHKTRSVKDKYKDSLSEGLGEYKSSSSDEE